MRLLLDKYCQFRLLLGACLSTFLLAISAVAQAGVVFEVEVKVMDILGDHGVTHYKVEPSDGAGGDRKATRGISPFQVSLGFKNSDGILHNFKGTDEELQAIKKDLVGRIIIVQGGCKTLSQWSADEDPRLFVTSRLKDGGADVKSWMTVEGAYQIKSLREHVADQCR
jgi:hypothetical protein